MVKTIVTFADSIAPKFLRFSLGIVLAWIGALKFVDPTPVTDLLEASFSFLAFNEFVYLLGIIEVLAGLLLFAGFKTDYVGVIIVALFTGTLVIFIIAPAVSYGKGGFPYLSLPGEFLLKDLVLMAASFAIIAQANTSK